MKPTVKKLLLSLYHYACFFLFMAFLITCSMLLFLSTLSNSLGIELTEATVKTAAIVTFFNVVFLSLIVTVIDALRRKFTVERPLQTILQAADTIAEGDYSVRIAPLSSLNRADGLDRVVDCFNRMAEALSTTETMQSDFITNLSHEIKTPLAVIGNYCTLLSDPALSHEERARYTTRIKEATERLSDLVGNILKLNKLENQQTLPQKTKYPLHEQLCECLLTFEAIFEEKAIEIETELDEILINADYDLLSLIWNNLFSNAFKFTPSGGKVSLSLKATSDTAVITLKDSGPGFSEEVGRHIFDKFYQGDRSHQTVGNGLGLALVKRVIALTGSEISVESEVGKGTTFTVTVKTT